jgi:adenylate kinase
MQLLLVAYPGAGKGTQATKLASHYRITHISSGELLRAEVTGDTRIGKIAADFLSRGDLVPDDLVFELLSAPVQQAVRSGGYVLDGFPRTLRQAEKAYAMVKQFENIELQAVIHLRVSRHELRTRIRARAGRENRTDDDEIQMTHRFEVFDTETEPLLGFYERRGILVDIDGERPVEVVFGDIVRSVDSLIASRAQRVSGRSGDT